MSRKENLQKIRQLRVPAFALLCAVVLTICAMLCVAMLMDRGVLGAGRWRLWAKLCLALGMVCAGVCICLRCERKILPLSLGVNVLALAPLLSLSYICTSENLSYGDLAVDLAVALVSAVLVSMVAAKRTKRKKPKKLHR